MVVNLHQVAVQSIRGITIFNVKNKSIDIKVKFIEDCMIDLTTGFGMIAVPRTKNGILLDFGSFQDSDQIKIQLRTQKTRGKNKPNGGKNKQISHLNQLIDQFKAIYPSIWTSDPNSQGYICIDESMVDWSSKKKLLPVGIKYPDYIEYKNRNLLESTGK